MRAKKSLAKPKKTVIFSNDFYSDMRADGMLHALIVRSPFSSGKINSIQLENQETLPENYEIFTADDIPGYASYQRRDCPFCKNNTPIEALVNSYGYSQL